MRQKAADSVPKPHIPFTEMLKSIPEFFGIPMNEEPDYEVIGKFEDFEVRRYPKLLLAQVSVENATFDDYREIAFKKLANFIFGGNIAGRDVAMTSPVLQQAKSIEMTSPVFHQRSSRTMAMTAPVLQTREASGAWTMSFVLPAKFTLQNVPKPIDDDIRLKEIPSRTIGVLKYHGNNSLEKMREHEAALSAALAANSEWKKAGEFFTAQYDAPFVIPIFKRNEIQVAVEPKH